MGWRYTSHVCRNGHDTRLLGLYTTRLGRKECVACRRARKLRYQKTPKGRATHNRAVWLHKDMVSALHAIVGERRASAAVRAMVQEFIRQHRQRKSA